MQKTILTSADKKIRDCLDNQKSFAVVAGAGSGKTTSLIKALEYLEQKERHTLLRDDQKVVCITYTNRAVDVISQRLGWDEMFLVCTLHKFLWDNIGQFTPNIRNVLHDSIIPEMIEKKKEDDNGGQSQKAIEARQKIERLLSDLENLAGVEKFTYNDTNFSDYSDGELSHDDVILIGARLINESPVLRKILGQKYPYIFVDEAQDTFEIVVNALNKLSDGEGLPVVGYFGDPMQQIYDDNRAGAFHTHAELQLIEKIENYRSSTEVIDFLNSFRSDLTQFPAGENKHINGSVLIRLVQAETPNASRNRYSEEQIMRATKRFEDAIRVWGWQSNSETKHLFLARQMIARRLGFPQLQGLFTGEFASRRAQDDYEKGEHFLLKPFTVSLCPLIDSIKRKDTNRILAILRSTSPAFDPQGLNEKQTLRDMIGFSDDITTELFSIWSTSTLGEVLRFAQKSNLCQISDRLSNHLNREPQKEEYDKEIHSDQKSAWLADAFFRMQSNEIEVFAKFIEESTPFSTQHGVKGEEYKNVLVVFDDVEASWNKYNYGKTLTPKTFGKPTEGQRDRSTKLAYVCFSRAKENLRIILFTTDPQNSKQELIQNGYFDDHQIEISWID